MELLGVFLTLRKLLYIFQMEFPQENLTDGKNKSIIRQVNFNRDDVSSSKSFKIDILSSRALSQLMYCQKKVDFNSHIGDPKTIELLCSGKNIGITLAETPLMKKALLS